MRARGHEQGVEKFIRAIERLAASRELDDDLVEAGARRVRRDYEMSLLKYQRRLDA